MKKKDCINCEEWIEGPLADCSKCSENGRKRDGIRVDANDERAQQDSCRA
jgi:hypothetical protein